MTLVHDEMRTTKDQRRASGRIEVRPCPSLFGTPRSAFTLVELLIVISIIAILSALLLGVAAGAAEQSRVTRTKAMIARLNALVMQQYDTYKDRRAPVSTAVEQYIRTNVQKTNRGPARAEARMYALRELMKMEMPDRWSDVLLKSPDNVNDRTDVGQPIYLSPSNGSTYGGPTPLVEAYRRKYFSMLNAGVDKSTIKDNEGAECLYMLVMFATADGEARGLFNESSIGDTDGDGAYEFLDGWGNPISFIRWPAGYESELQSNARKLEASGGTAWQQTATDDHDPFDPFRMDPTAFRVVPLIYSLGRHEHNDLFAARNSPLWPSAGVSQFMPSYPRLSLNGKLEGKEDGGSVLATEYLGSPMNEEGTAIDSEAGVDVITNHYLTGE